MELYFTDFRYMRPENLVVERAAHLKSINIPMLFLQGTR